MKINHDCIYTVKITKHVHKTVTTYACFIHYGHSKNIGYTWISQKKRNEIAANSLQDVSKEKILDDIRNNVGVEFLRDHIIDKPDRVNI